MRIKKETRELVEAGIISEDTANEIHAYYERKNGQSHNRLLTAFGILGAALFGLGLVLIIAHNWQDFSRVTKIALAFLPLLAGQGICGTVLLKKAGNRLWHEGSATFLFFCVGASISIVSQIYHIPGDLSSFLLTWMPLCLPIIYIMRSSMVSLLFIIGITTYLVDTAYWNYPSAPGYPYWLLFLLVLPYYYWLYKTEPVGNFMAFHNWFLPLSLTISLGGLAQSHHEFMNLAYAGLFGVFYGIGKLDLFNGEKMAKNGYLVVGSLGTVYILLLLSFMGFWEDLSTANFVFKKLILSREIGVTAVLILLAILIYRYLLKHKTLSHILPMGPVFIALVVIFIIGLLNAFAVVLVNLLVLAIGIEVIRTGARENHLGVLNYGLVIIAALVVCRFFDTDLSFVLRGILFMVVGAGFFLTNLLMIRKRKANA